MAQTTATDLNDAVAAEIVADRVVATAYAAITLDRMIPHDTIQGSLTKSYPRLGKLTAAALTDGTDGVATAVSDTQVSAAVAEIGIGVALTDLARVGSSVANMQDTIANLLGKAYANKVDIDGLALSANLTDQVGSTGVALTEDVFFQAPYEVEANDGIGLMLAYILFPKQWNNMMTALAGVTENQSAIWGRADFLSEVRPADLMGYKTSVNGMPIFVSTNVPTANAGADSRGMCFAVGEDSPFLRLIGLLDGQEWDARYEVERDASLRANEVWVTGATGFCTRAPDRGAGIISVR